MKNHTNSRGKVAPGRAVVCKWGQGGLSPRGHLAMSRSIFDYHKNDTPPLFFLMLGLDERNLAHLKSLIVTLETQNGLKEEV